MVVDTTVLLETLAATGLPDDAYAAVVSTVRALDARARAGRQLAEIVLRNECYQPSEVLTACGGVIGADHLASVA